MSTGDDRPPASTLLRGIKKAEWLGSRDKTVVLAAAFHPPNAVPLHRDDGGMETSIDHQDGPEALLRIRADKERSAHGVAMIALQDIVSLPSKSMEGVKVERRRIKGNEFHGNIVFCNMTWDRAKVLAGAIASVAIVDTPGAPYGDRDESPPDAAELEDKAPA